MNSTGSVLESIRYLGLLILVSLASCTTNATVAVQVGTGGGDAGVIADTEVEKTTTVTGEEIPPEGSSNGPPVDAAPPNTAEEPVPPSATDKMTPPVPVDEH